MIDFESLTPAEQATYVSDCAHARGLQGRQIIVPKGTKLHCCTSPWIKSGNGIKGGNRPVPTHAGRDIVVEVSHSVGDVVRWPGSGGYWRGAKARDVVVCDA